MLAFTTSVLLLFCVIKRIKFLQQDVGFNVIDSGEQFLRHKFPTWIFW